MTDREWLDCFYNLSHMVDWLGGRYPHRAADAAYWAAEIAAREPGQNLASEAARQRNLAAWRQVTGAERN